MYGIDDQLRHELRDAEYSEGYTESFLNAYIATQTKVIREQRGLTQSQLAGLMGTTQTAISRIENVNYSAWNIKTLKKLARALHVRLKVSFETYGSLPDEVLSFGRENLERVGREHDPGLWSDAPAESIREAVAANQRETLAQYAARAKDLMDVAPAASQPVIFAGPLFGIGALSSLFAGIGQYDAGQQVEAPENRTVNQRTDFGIAKFAPPSAPAATEGYENRRIHLVPTEGKRRHRTASRRRFLKGDSNARRATA
jgi:transcriptional regulator with XRE-family HTH domain